MTKLKSRQEPRLINVSYANKCVIYRHNQVLRSLFSAHHYYTFTVLSSLSSLQSSVFSPQSSVPNTGHNIPWSTNFGVNWTSWSIPRWWFVCKVMKRVNRNPNDDAEKLSDLDTHNNNLSRDSDKKSSFNLMQSMGLFLLCLMLFSVLFSVSVVLRDPPSDAVVESSTSLVFQDKQSEGKVLLGCSCLFRFFLKKN